jgi:hypothetical protein
MLIANCAMVGLQSFISSLYFAKVDVHQPSLLVVQGNMGAVESLRQLLLEPPDPGESGEGLSALLGNAGDGGHEVLPLNTQVRYRGSKG